MRRLLAAASAAAFATLAISAPAQAADLEYVALNEKGMKQILIKKSWAPGWLGTLDAYEAEVSSKGAKPTECYTKGSPVQGEKSSSYSAMTMDFAQNKEGHVLDMAQFVYQYKDVQTAEFAWQQLLNKAGSCAGTHTHEIKDDSGKTVGFDVDLMDLVAKKLGVTQEIVDIEFEQITSGAVFAAKKCDAGAAAITITDERKQATGFSDPYFAATQALLVKSDSTVTDLAGLKGQTLAVQAGTTGHDYAKKNADANGYTVKVFDDMPSGANAVLAGTVAAAINDNGVLYDFAKQNPTTKVATEFATGEHYGFNMAKDNTALLTVVNEVLKTAKSDGTYNDIYKKWFGTDAPKE